MVKESITVTDNRTGKSIEVPIEKGSIPASAFAKLGKIQVLDPSYSNTACVKSAITEIDGDQGVLRYRGYPIEVLAEKSTFLEVAFLLIYGNLPSKQQLSDWEKSILSHTFVNEHINELMKSFQYDAHPMSMLISAIASMSAFHPEANPSLAGMNIYKSGSPDLRNKQIARLIGKVTSVAANAYRHRIGRPYNSPSVGLSYTDNFLFMLDHLNESNYTPHPVLSKALDVLFILHADHELNCSTATMRQIGSSLVDPYSSVAGAASALFGPLHGGACESVLRMLEEIGSVDKVPSFLEGVKRKERKLMGFGHRVYKNYDPRAKIIRRVAFQVFEVLGEEPLVKVAIELERLALQDNYFISKKLYPNVDFYSGLIYKSMGFPTDMFPVLFAIPRVAGWLAHWKEEMEDQNGKIWRPRQVYVGHEKRDYRPLEDRPELPADISYTSHPFWRRTKAAKAAAKL